VILFADFQTGDITSVSLFGTTIVAIHTYEKATALLDKKSLIYSGRMKIQMLHLGGMANHVSMLPYGSQLKQCRRLLRSEINPRKIENYHPLQESMTRRFLSALSRRPEQFYDRVEWYDVFFVDQADEMTKCCSGLQGPPF